MSKHPTPGPYRIVRARPGDGLWVINSEGMKVAWFWFGRGILHDMPEEEAEANARAWVEGREAMETLKKIRTAMASVSFGQRALEVRDIALSIIEAKP